MRRTMAVLAVAATLVLGACSEGNGGPGTQLSPGTRLIASLQPFDACDDLLDWFHTEGARRVGPYGLPGLGGYGLVVPLAGSSRSAEDAAAGAAGQGKGAESNETTLPDPLRAGADYSGTNVQEVGVDEADLVKTDGRRLVTIGLNRLHVLDTTGEQPSLVGTVELPTDLWNHQLLLDGDRVLVLSNGMSPVEGTSGEPGTNPDEAVMSIAPPLPGTSAAVLTEIDLGDPTRPQIVAALTIDGTQVSARSIGHTARIVVQSDPSSMGFVDAQGARGEDVATETNRRVVEESTLDQWLPSYTLDDRRPGGGADAEGRLVPCDHVSRPPDFSGFGTLSVLTVDLSKPLALGDVTSVLAGGRDVYASTEHLFVATTRYDQLTPGSSAPKSPSASTSTTEIHAFAITGAEPARYLASGQVKGTLLNQFSMSEYEGHLRVATTTEPLFRATPMAETAGPDDAVQSDDTVQPDDAVQPDDTVQPDDVVQSTIDRSESDPAAAVSESMVSVLSFDEGRLGQVGQVSGLGRNERIYAVRFIGDRGYVVTFRQTDPLYVLDLSDPTAPAVQGELKVAGYSAYLHPVDETLLLGLGQDADEQGRTQGTQLALFDVSDPADPTRLHHFTMPQSSSEAEYDHHAFLYWPRTGLTVIPVQSNAPPNPFVGALAVTVDRTAGITEKGRITQPVTNPWEGAIHRSLMIGDHLYAVSEVGVLAVDPATLTTRAWIDFTAS